MSAIVRPERATIIFLCLASISLVARVGIVKPYTLQLFEFFIILSAASTTAGWLAHGMDERWQRLLQRSLPWFCGILSCMLLGTMISDAFFGISREAAVALAKDLFYLLTVFTCYLLLYYHAPDPQFRKAILYSLFFPLVWSIFLFMPETAVRAGLTGDFNTLVGLSRNQNILAASLLIPFGWSWHKVLISSKLTFLKIPYYAAATLSCSLIIWTGSRGAYLAGAFILGCLLVYAIKVSKFRASTYLLLAGFLVTVSLVISVLLVPHEGKVAVQKRISPGPFIWETSVTSANPSPVQTPSLLLPKNTLDLMIPAQSRGNLWKQGGILAATHPFGLGPEYALVSGLIREKDGRLAPAHNTILQVVLSGGFILLTGFGILLYRFLTYIRCHIKNPEMAAYIFIIGGIVITMLLNDYLFTLPWAWIMIALFIGSADHISAGLAENS